MKTNALNRSNIQFHSIQFLCHDPRDRCHTCADSGTGAKAPGECARALSSVPWDSLWSTTVTGGPDSLWEHKHGLTWVYTVPPVPVTGTQRGGPTRGIWVGYNRRACAIDNAQAPTPRSCTARILALPFDTSVALECRCAWGLISAGTNQMGVWFSIPRKSL